MPHLLQLHAVSAFLAVSQPGNLTLTSNKTEMSEGRAHSQPQTWHRPVIAFPDALTAFVQAGHAAFWLLLFRVNASWVQSNLVLPMAWKIWLALPTQWVSTSASPTKIRCPWTSFLMATAFQCEVSCCRELELPEERLKPRADFCWKYLWVKKVLDSQKCSFHLLFHVKTGGAKICREACGEAARKDHCCCPPRLWPRQHFADVESRAPP